MFWKRLFSFTLIFVALTVPAIGAHAVSLTETNAEPPPTSASSEEYEIFQLINRERNSKGLPALQWDDSVASLARSYSRRMARDGFFAHTDPDGNSVVERADNSRVRGWAKIGENLFFCSPADQFSDMAIRGWMRSPAHRKNVLDREWTATGIGVARARNGRVYVTQVFIER